MKIYLNEKKLTLNILSLLYVAIIGFFIFFVTKDLEYNTAFIDEAIYATVGEEVLRGSFWENATSWMGGSYIYPVTSALINREAGLKGIRLYSVFCMLITGIVAGKIGKKLGGESIEVLTLFLFYFTAVTLNVAQMATYDAPSIMFTSLSFLAALDSRSKERKKELVLPILSGIFISTAVLTKYIAVLFIPVIALTIFWRKQKPNFIALFAYLFVILGLVGVYIALYYSDVMTYLTGSYSKEPASLAKIAGDIFSHLNIAIVTAFLSLWFFFEHLRKYRFNPFSLLKDEKNKTWLLLLLLTGGFMTISFHLATLNYRSMWKHMVFSSLFLSPVTAYVIIRTQRYIKIHQASGSILINLSQLIATIVTIATITSLWVNFSRHWKFQRSWPSASNVITFLDGKIKPGGKVFAEGSAVYKYHLYTGFDDPYAWSSTWYLEYKGEKDIPAMKAAIRDQAFDYIIFNNYFTPGINAELMPDVYGYYEKVMEDTYKVSGEYENPTTVWAPRKS